MLTPDALLARFAAFARVDVADLTGPRRSSVLTRLRAECMWHLRVASGATLAEIGALLGGRGSSTVREAIETLRARMIHEPDLAGNLASMATALRLVGEPAGVVTSGDTVPVIAARGVLADPGLSDADARHAALALLTAGGGDAES